jgi:hypothetical protein
MIGQRVSQVIYYQIPYESPDDLMWDFDQWHRPDSGVELITTEGRVYSCVWGDAFGQFSLEVFPDSMSAHFAVDQKRRWEVTQHPRWASALTQPIKDAAIVSPQHPRWAAAIVSPTELADGWLPRPVATRLDFGDNAIWIVAGEPLEWPPTGRFWLGTEDVMVVFSRDLAQELGLVPMDADTER